MKYSKPKRKPRKKTSHKVSVHFSKNDFICQCGECKKKLKLSLGLIGGLELLRSKTKNRINIHKGYICPAALDKLTSTKRNYHAKGIAADITIDNTSLEDTFKLAEAVPEFLGIGINLTHNIIHVDTRKTDDRTTWVVEKDSTHHTPITTENREKYLGKES